MLARFIGKPPSFDIDGARHSDFASFKRARVQMKHAVVVRPERLDTACLNTVFEYTSNVEGKARVLPFRMRIPHVFNHPAHHRGQVTTRIKPLGYEPGIADIPWLTELDAVAA